MHCRRSILLNRTTCRGKWLSHLQHSAVRFGRVPRKVASKCGCLEVFAPSAAEAPFILENFSLVYLSRTYIAVHSKILLQLLFSLPSSAHIKTIAVECSQGMITINSLILRYPLCKLSKKHPPSFRPSLSNRDAKLRLEIFRVTFGTSELIDQSHHARSLSNTDTFTVSRSFQSSSPPLVPRQPFTLDVYAPSRSFNKL